LVRLPAPRLLRSFPTLLPQLAIAHLFQLEEAFGLPLGHFASVLRVFGIDVERLLPVAIHRRRDDMGVKALDTVCVVRGVDDVRVGQIQRLPAPRPLHSRPVHLRLHDMLHYLAQQLTPAGPQLRVNLLKLGNQLLRGADHQGAHQHLLTLQLSRAVHDLPPAPAQATVYPPVRTTGTGDVMIAIVPKSQILQEPFGLAIRSTSGADELPVGVAGHALSPDEERARQHLGELIGWHPVALRLCTAEAGDTSWQKVEALVLEGNLNPDDFGELARWVQKSWDRLPEADQQALADLRRALREASTFGAGIAAAVWDHSLAQAQVRISRLEARALIERVTEEPPPWQEMIQQAYGGQERYRLIPLLRVMGLQPPGGLAEQAQLGAEDIKWLRAIERRARALPIGPGQIPWQFRLANLFVLPAAWLLRRDSGRLEERLMNLWNRQGLHPPAEVWLSFQKSRWAYLSFGYAIGVFLLLLGAWYLWTAFRDGDATWGFVALLAWACALPTVYLFIRQRAWWLWLLGLHGQETTELQWTWRVAGLFGLHKPLDQTAILSWRTSPPSPQ
jgi:hypothetical protein